MSREIRIHIDRLVLDPAFADLDREALGAAVERELAARMGRDAQVAPVRETGHRARVDGGLVAVEPGVGEAALGRRIAQGVYRGMVR